VNASYFEVKPADGNLSCGWGMPLAQSPVHGGEPLALCGVCDYTGVAGG
jgi:hypothetical protein